MSLFSAQLQTQFRPLQSTAFALARETKAGTVIVGVLTSILFGFVLPLPAAQTRIATIRNVHRAKYQVSEPIRLRGTVTAFSGWRNSFFLQDASDAISIDRLENTEVQPGDEVEVAGHVRSGLFAPIVVSDSVTVIGHRELPTARKASYDELSNAQFDSKRVEVNGIVQSAEVSEVWGRTILMVRLQAGSGTITTHVLDFPRRDVQYLVDSTVRVTGVCGSIFNDQKQLVGLRLFVPDLDQVRVVKQAVPIHQLPLSPLERLLRFDNPSDDHRVKVSGTVTYQSAPSEFYLRDGGAAIRVRSQSSGAWAVGSRINAAGFISSSAFLPVLRDAVVENSNVPAQVVEPLRVQAKDAIRMDAGFAQAPYNGQLVELRARLLEVQPTGGRPLLFLRDGKVHFQAQLSANAPQRAIGIEPGSDVSITGICLAELDDNQSPVSFRILVRSAEDIKALSTPYWSSSILLLLAVVALILLGSACLWIYHRLSSRLGPEALHVPVAAHLQQKCVIAARGLALVSALLGAAVVLGWRFDIGFLQIEFAHSPVLPNPAAGFLAAGIAILCATYGRPWSSVLTLAGVSLCVVIGLTTLVEYGTSSDLHIDQLLIRNAEKLAGYAAPGRMAIATALCLILTGLAIVLTNRKWSAGLGQVLAVAAGVIALLNLVAILFGSQLRHGAGFYATMALPSASSILCLDLAVLLSRTDWGFMRSFLSLAGGGLMARRMLPVALLAPVVLGWLRLQGQIAGWYDTRFGISIFACSNVVCFGFLIWSCADFLNRLEAERSRAEAGLEERDRRLEQVFQDASIGDFCWDAVTNHVSAHPVVWKLYGASNPAGGQPAGWFQQCQHPEDRRRVELEMQAALEGNRKLDTEFRVVRPDGSIRWICCRAQVDCDDFGKLLRVVGITFDVTDRKIAELSATDREKRFQQLADAMPQIVWTSSGDGPIDYYNQRWYEYTGLSLADAWEQVIHEDDLLSCEVAREQSFATGSPLETEIRIRRASDGEYRWHLARSMPIRDGKGDIERWFGTSTDIDDYKRATAELERLNRDLESRVRERSVALFESEQLHRLMIECVADYSIFMLDPHGRVSSWNAGAERIKQYTAGEILGKHFSIFYPTDLVAAKHPEAELQIAAITGQYREEGWRVRKDGSHFWASVSITRIQDKDGTIRAFSKVVRDMTEQRRADEAVRAEQRRAEDANRAKSEFLAAMSHEIRTPMNAILGMADLLWETELEATQRQYVEIFRRAGGNLLTLVNDILDLSKIESGHFTLEQVTFNLEELVSRTVELIRSKATAKGLHISATVSSAIAPGLTGDPTRLQQILINLLGNAVKFTERGEVSLAVDVDDARPDHLMFRVSDTGIGIPQEKLLTIFEDFTQAESSTTRRFGGTGLGLGICRRLVARMGGQLSVTSEYGKGSCFSFDALFGVSKETSHLEHDATRDLAGRRLLILDHNPTTRMIFTDMCSHWGMQTAECSDGATVVRMLAEAENAGTPFEAVLVDRQALDGGFALIERIRAENPTLVLIMTTSDNAPGEATRAKQLRVAGYMPKPVRRYDLLRLLCRAFATGGLDDARQQASHGAEHSPNPELRVPRILIAEDSEDNRFLVQAYLKDAPYELVFAENGELAVQAYGAEEFDLVLMDMQMPVLDGLAATRKIRGFEQSQSNTSVPIIALTANARSSDISDCETAGCTSHLSKPIAKTTLIGAIERHLSLVQRECSPEERPVIEVPLGLEEAAKRYITMRHQDVARMHGLLRAADFDSIRVLAHNMKGTGVPYGFPVITNLGRDIEAWARDRNGNAVGAKLLRLGDYVSKAMDMVLGPSRSSV
jgi:PAS domain S-box-containing protein